MPMSRVRVIFFDAVGTLIYPDPPAPEVYFEVGKRFRSKLSREQIVWRFKTAFDRQEQNETLSKFDRTATDEHCERQRWQAIVSEVFDDVNNAEGALFEALWNHFAQGAHWNVFPDVINAWNELERRSIRIGIASNFDKRLEEICRSHPPLNRCHIVCWSAEVGWPKPSPLFFRVLQQRVDATPDELLLIGDTVVNDYEGARAAGWHAVLIDRTSKNVVHDSVRTLHELAGHLDENQCTD